MSNHFFLTHSHTHTHSRTQKSYSQKKIKRQKGRNKVRHVFCVKLKIWHASQTKTIHNGTFQLVYCKIWTENFPVDEKKERKKTN